MPNAYPAVTLKTPTAADLPFYFSYRSNPAIAAAEGRIPDQTTTQAQKHLHMIIAGNGSANYSWFIVPAGTETPVGTIAIWGFSADRTTAELAYGLLPKFQHHGYMHAALAQVTAFAFSRLQLTRLDCYTAASNTPSINLLTSSGFTHRETITEDNLAGAPTTMVIYAQDRPL